MKPSQAAEPDATPDLPSIVRYYVFIGAMSLFVLWFALLERGFDLFSLVPVGLGALGMAPALIPKSWRSMRVLRGAPTTLLAIGVIFTIVILEILFSPGRVSRSDFFRMTDLLLVTGLIGYFVCQFRVVTLTGNLVPIDDRPRADRLGGDEPESRNGVTAKPRELLHLAWLAPVCMIAGQLLWQWVLQSEKWDAEAGIVRLGISTEWWRLYVLIWILAVTGLLLTGAIALLRWHRLTRAEAEVLAQETLWNETRSEQRRIHRWLAWMHRKHARKKGILP
jgi:hypothetical protein